jgi:hypothetical protein
METEYVLQCSYNPTTAIRTRPDAPVYSLATIALSSGTFLWYRSVSSSSFHKNHDHYGKERNTLE